MNCKVNVQERIFDKDKMSKRKKSELVSCFFGPLISKWFVGLNDKKYVWRPHVHVCIYVKPG